MNCTVTQHPAGGGNDSATQLSLWRAIRPE